MWWKSSEEGATFPGSYLDTSLPFPSSISSFFSSAEIPFKCFGGEQMSKTTFQIPMCVLVPILNARLRVCVSQRKNGRKEVKKNVK